MEKLAYKPQFVQINADFMDKQHVNNNFIWRITKFIYIFAVLF